MKTKDEIINEIYVCQKLLENRKKDYAALGQIDLLSGEGRILSKTINYLEAKIEALYWVLS